MTIEKLVKRFLQGRKRTGNFIKTNVPKWFFALTITIALIGMGLVEPSQANTTYAYTGNAFAPSFCTSGPNCTCLTGNLTATVTFDDTINASSTQAEIVLGAPPVGVVSCSVSADGITDTVTADQTNASGSLFGCFFNLSDGKITGWDISTIDTINGTYFSVGSSSNYVSVDGVSTTDSASIIESPGSSSQATFYGANLNQPGTWTLGGAASVAAKTLGSPCGPGGCSAGDPIAVGIGNVYEQVTDYKTSGQNTLGFTRYYNSMGKTQNPNTLATTLGTNWRSNFDRYLTIVSGISGTSVVAERPDGQAVTFTLSGSTWTTDSDVGIKLTQTKSTWTLQDRNDTVETYTVSGSKVLLKTITARDGYAQTLFHNAANQLTSVTDSNGRTLQFTYQNNLIATVTTPGGLVLTYGYDSSGTNGTVLDRLATVAWSTTPPTSLTCVYENASFPFAMTGVIDELGNRYTTWTYDTQGRGTSSQHASGADLTQIAYNDTDGSRAVTGALGEQDTYEFTTLQSVPKETEIEQAADGTVQAATRQFTYDANGYPASTTDWNGNVTAFTNDARGDQISRTEAQGTAQACTITTAWHPTFHLPTMITEPNRVTTFAYDAHGNLLKKTITAGALKRTWTYTYNKSGQPLTSTGPRGDVKKFTYDTKGNLTVITDALAHKTSITSYDPDGRPLSIKDPNGLVANLAYDARGRLASRTVGTETTTYAHDVTGNLTKVTLPDGSYLAYTYDTAHRLTNITDALGNQIVYTLDAMGNRLAEQVFDPSNTLSKTRSHVYDALSRLAQDIGAQSQTTAYGYDNNGNLTGVTDPLGNQTSNAFDALNRLIQMTDPNGGLTKYGYDANDHLTSLTDPRNLTTAYAYDGLNDLTSTQSPDTGATTNTFDAAGNVTASTDARGEKTTYTYDLLNRPTKATYADKTSTTWQYDKGTNGIGHLTEMTDPSGTTTWQYDQYGREIQKQQKTGTVMLTTSTAYDAAGRVATIIYPSGQKIAHIYDAKSGQLAGIQVDGQALISNVSYQPFGPIAQWTAGNGAAYVRSFDLDGRLTGLTLGNTGDLVALSYDKASRITGITETALSSWSFGYDALSHLTSYTDGSAETSYIYDADGNRANATSPQGATAYQYATASNRLLNRSGLVTQTNTYDKAGNLTSDGSTFYTTNARGRLAEVTTSAITQYGINGIGQRVSKSGSLVAGGATHFMYGPAGNLLGEYDATGKALEETVWLGNLPVGVLKSGAVYYVNPDYLGAPHSITDQTGNLVWTWDRDPFGNGQPNQKPGSAAAFAYNLRLPGQYFDSESGLFYNMNRDYNPAIGRYIQSDPIGLKAGVNTYAYVRGNPVSNVDRFGLMAPNEDLCAATEGASCITSHTYGGGGGEIDYDTGSPGLLQPQADIIPPETADAAGSDLGGQCPWSNYVYPPNNGFLGEPTPEVLPPGTDVGRFGDPGGSFFAPAGTEPQLLSLPPGTIDLPYTTYTVIRPLPVYSGPAAPWFGQPGGGAQYLSPNSVGWLVEQGYLK